MTYNHQYILLSCLIYLWSFSSTTAQLVDGIDFDPIKYDKIPSTPQYGAGAKSMLNLTQQSVDLSKYAPAIIDQGTANSCVAWATAYYAYTIQRGSQNNIIQKEILKDIALSAIFPYQSLVKQHCDQSLHIDDVASFIMKNGGLLYNQLPQNSCQAVISDKMKAKAKEFAPIRSFQKVFSSQTPKNNRSLLIMNELDKNKRPVIVALDVFKNNFDRLNFNNDYYDPSMGGTETIRHAVTVVGYDLTKKALKLVNSQGSNFGKGGYFWMSMDHFNHYVLGAITLTLADHVYNAPKSLSLQMGGELTFLHQSSLTNKFESGEIPYHSTNGLYLLNKRNWKVNHYFQLMTNNIQRDLFLCVFSINSHFEITKHWPLLTTTDRMSSNMLIPSVNSVLSIKEEGVDYVCALYSNNSLTSDMPAILERITKSQDPDIMARIREALGNRLIDLSEINYQSMGMSFSTNATHGDTVPVVLKIESVK